MDRKVAARKRRAGRKLAATQRSTGAVTFNSISISLPLGDPVTAGAVKAKHKKKHRKHKHHR